MIRTFWNEVASVISQASLVWSKKSECNALYLLSQDIPAIQVYANGSKDTDTPATVASRVINRFLLEQLK